MTQLDQTHPSNSSEEITVDIKELVGLLWGGRKLIISVTSVIAVCTVFYALSLTNHYISNATMSMIAVKSKSHHDLTGIGGLGVVCRSQYHHLKMSKGGYDSKHD